MNVDDSFSGFAVQSSNNVVKAFHLVKNWGILEKFFRRIVESPP